MAAVKSTNTGPELAIRRLLFRLGYRFRLHAKTLPGRPDIVFPGRHAAIFVHGCFWHGHSCSKGRLPKSRIEFWSAKVRANRQRDRRSRAQLRRLGWRSLTVWQCALRHPTRLLDKLVRFLETSTPSPKLGRLPSDARTP